LQSKKTDAFLPGGLPLACFISAPTSSAAFSHRRRKAVQNLKLKAERFEIDTLDAGSLLAGAAGARGMAERVCRAACSCFSLGHSLEHYAWSRKLRGSKRSAELASGGTARVRRESRRDHGGFAVEGHFGAGRMS